jgi:sulfate permease, SulP family
MMLNCYLFNLSRELVVFSFKEQAKRVNIKLANKFKLPAKNNLSLNSIKTEMLSGITVALALIPESLAFAAIAQVPPMVALYTSFCIAISISIFGGRPAMISAATGSMSLLMTTLVTKYGIEYLFAATILTGMIQFLMGVFQLGRFFTFVPQSVVSGFVNALGILIFIAQIKQFAGESLPMYLMVAGTLGIVYLLPRFTKAIPSPLVAIVVMTIVAISTNANVRRVGNIGAITSQLPSIHLPQVSFSLETLAIILPYAFTLSIVGLLESLLTADLLDELTESKSSKNQEVRGQGIANIITGFFGGMAGCGMVGQSIINIRSGGRGRLSTFVSGAFLLVLIFALKDIVLQIPMAALIGVMIMVAFETFDWKSLQQIRKMSPGEAAIMPLTMGITLLTHDLAKGVLVGVIVSALIFGWKAAKIKVAKSFDDAGSKVYTVSGQLFFASTAHFGDVFNYNEDPEKVIIDFNFAHIWDFAAVTAVSKVIERYRKLDKSVEVRGLNIDSQTHMHRAGIYDTGMS